MGRLMYKENRLNSTSPDGLVIPKVIALSGSSSITIYDSRIHTSSYISIYPRSESGTLPNIKSYRTTEGHVEITFSKLSEDTEFRIRVNN